MMPRWRIMSAGLIQEVEGDESSEGTIVEALTVHCEDIE